MNRIILSDNFNFNIDISWLSSKQVFMPVQILNSPVRNIHEFIERYEGIGDTVLLISPTTSSDLKCTDTSAYSRIFIESSIFHQSYVDRTVINNISMIIAIYVVKYRGSHSRVTEV